MAEWIILLQNFLKKRVTKLDLLVANRMNSTPLFSVLMANFNNGRYISAAVESILSQTYSNWELIFVDDCSNDNSIEIIERYKADKRIHVFKNEVNSGCGYTKHRCVELAQGDICGFVDADDSLSCDAIQTMVEAHLINLSASLVYSRYFGCDENLNVQEISQHQCDIPKGSSFLEYKRGAISHFVSFKREYYLKTDGISTTMRAAVDLDLYLKLEEAGDVVFVDKPLYYYRRGTGNNISLGDRVRTAAIWEFVTKTDACRRRNLNAESVTFPLFELFVDERINSLPGRMGEIIELRKKHRIYGKMITASILVVSKIDRLENLWKKSR